MGIEGSWESGVGHANNQELRYTRIDYHQYDIRVNICRKSYVYVIIAKEVTKESCELKDCRRK